jgi:putative FmdB family regulatory protein
MPVYEYSCKACGHEFEREQRISDAPIKKCPSCGALKARRLISRTSFVLKGGGWYNDLYATPSSKKAAEEAKPGAEAKPAAESKPGAEATSSRGAEATSSPGGEAAAAPAGESTADGGGKPAGPSGKGPKKGGKGAKAAA